MAWFDFAICALFGVLGVHKFRERNTKMGFVYLFTGGLLLCGWIYDCIRYYNLAAEDTAPPDSSNTTPSGNKAWNIAKKIVLWYLAAMLLIFALVFMPSWCAFLFLIASILLLPINKWQNTIKKHLKTPIKTTLIVLLAFIGLVTVPKNSLLDTTLAVPTEVTQSAEAATEKIAPTSTTPIDTEPKSTTTQATETPVVPATTPTTPPSTEPVHTHSFSIATCTVPATCSCGETKGTVAEHKWSDATCTVPKTCTVCKITSGSATNHNYSKGKCTDCDAKDPDYTETTYVLNVKSMKFHRPTCSKLPTENRRDTTQSREEVIEAGYDPCGICHP